MWMLLLSLVGVHQCCCVWLVNFFFEFPHGKFVLIICCLLVDRVPFMSCGVFEERYVRSFDGMEASFHELK